jgi:hypothetical protein
MSEIKEQILAKGTVHVLLVDEVTGEVKVDETYENLIVTTGFGHITSRLIGVAQNVASHMAIGTTNTAAAVGQTTLVAEVGRVALSSYTQVTTTLTNDSVQAVATFPAGTGTGSIVEAALLNAASVGTMLNRVVFGVITKGASDALTITWKIAFA